MALLLKKLEKGTSAFETLLWIGYTLIGVLASIFLFIYDLSSKTSFIEKKISQLEERIEKLDLYVFHIDKRLFHIEKKMQQR